MAIEIEDPVRYSTIERQASDLLSDLLELNPDTKTSNTMDNIIVEYGVQIDPQKGKNFDFISDDEDDEEYLQNISEEARKNIKRVTLPEFLKIPPEQLSKMEQKIQKAAAFIYHENGRNPPLFQRFPNWRPDKPLTIDCSYAPSEPSDDALAFYRPSQNRILFEVTDDSVDLIKNLAHELKHAEQDTEKMHKLEAQCQNNNGYGYKQILLSQEAEADLFGLYVSMLKHKDKTPEEMAKLFNRENLLLFNGVKIPGVANICLGFTDLLSKDSNMDLWCFGWVKKYLLSTAHMLIERSSYNDDCDNVIPIKRTDNPLNPRLLYGNARGHFSVLKTARTPATRLKQLKADLKSKERISKEDMDLIENKDGKFFGKYAKPDKADYARLLLSHGQIKRLITLVKTGALDTNFSGLCLVQKAFIPYLNNKKKKTLTADDMELFEQYQYKAEDVLPALSFKPMYLKHLLEQGEAKRATHLISIGFVHKQVGQNVLLNYLVSKRNNPLASDDLEVFGAKDEKERFIIDRTSLNRFAEQAQKEELKYMLKLSSIWLTQHPKDARFIQVKKMLMTTSKKTYTTTASNSNASNNTISKNGTRQRNGISIKKPQNDDR